jgi:hypothetical protein
VNKLLKAKFNSKLTFFGKIKIIILKLSCPSFFNFLFFQIKDLVLTITTFSEIRVKPFESSPAQTVGGDFCSAFGF